MDAREKKFAKETKVAKEVIVISSSDDEVSSDDAVSSDEELTSHEVSCDDEVSSEEEVTIIASSKGSYKSLLKWYDDSSDEDILEYYFAMSKASNSKEAWFRTFDAPSCCGGRVVVEYENEGYNVTIRNFYAINLFYGLRRRKIPESPWGSPIPIGDGDGDVNRFPDGDGDGDEDEAEKRGWGCSDETPSSDDTSSDGPSSDETYYDDSIKKPKTTARKGPKKELLKWYEDIIDEEIAKSEVVVKSKDSRLNSRKSIMDNSFGSAEEVDHLRILQSYNGLLLCTAIQISHGLHQGRNFLEYFGGYSDDPVLILVEIPQMLHLEGNFFESRGCLLLVCRDEIGSRDLTIYETRKGCSVWLVRYHVNTGEIMNPLPGGWSIRLIV
ncbi:hypothetical protein Tco_0379177 [Tanacetum coccineum]